MKNKIRKTEVTQEQYKHLFTGSSVLADIFGADVGVYTLADFKLSGEPLKNAYLIETSNEAESTVLVDETGIVNVDAAIRMYLSQLNEEQ